MNTRRRGSRTARTITVALLALAGWVGVTQWAVNSYCDDEVIQP